jgi:type VI secretion system protein ImpL
MDPSIVMAYLSKLDVAKTSALAVGILVGLVALVWFLRRVLRKPKIVGIDVAGDGCAFCARVRGWFTGLFDALDYLATRREWRYAQPWILVLGGKGAGKSSLVASSLVFEQHPRPAKARELKATGMQWAFLRRGVLIDADGALACAAEGSEGARDWAKGLDMLDALRPERPLDGVVLCVSARSLRGAKRTERAALAADANRQLGQLQAAVEFMLPVYVVVTQCDDVPGFDAFWRNLAPERRREMFGYSAMPQDQNHAPAEWAETAFDCIGERLREVLVDVAGLSERVDDVDGFFLFPGRFRELRAPLTDWLETVFRTTAWQSGHLFRGLYFTGTVAGAVAGATTGTAAGAATGTVAGAPRDGARDDVAFVDALVADKVLCETALARPTRQGMWSRNGVIRRVQYASIVGLAALLVALGVAGVRVSRQVDTLVTGMHTLKEVVPRVPPPESGECLASEDVYPLLAHVSRVDTRSRRLVIPLSWVDSRLTSRSATVVGNTTVEGVLLPTLSCLLEKRARDLLGASRLTTTAEGAAYSVQRSEFRRLLVESRALEDNLKRYESLSKRAPMMGDDEVLATLAQLSQYAFGEPVPRIVLRRGGVLDDAFRNIGGRPPQPVMPNGLQARMTTAIDARAASLRTALGREVAAGATLLSVLDQGRQPILDNTRRMGTWMTWVQGQWLGSSPERNPCQEIVEANKADVEALIGYYGSSDTLERLLRKFNEAQCYQPELRVLAGMEIAPYGPLFLPGKDGLVLSPGVQVELGGMPALVALPFMQLRSAAPFRCLGGAARWRASEIAEAAGYLDQYEAFAKARKLPSLPEGGRPLYDRLARASLAHAMDDALRRAQQASADIDAETAAAARSDAALAEVGNELARGLPSLQRVLNAHAQLGFADDGAKVRQCARDFAADNLGGVDALADASRLYSPAVPAGGDALYALGSVPVAKDFLARQVARAEVLAGYADPFLSLLAGTTGVDDAWRDTPQTDAFWRNTRTEIDSYTKGKEPSGQVANLDALVIGQLTGMTYQNCGSLLAAYKSPESGNDLFSERRRRLERQVELRCTDRRAADAEAVYGALATRFNRDLAGRYPFAPLDARDANPALVREFFLDYARDRTRIGDALRELQGARWREASAFVESLDRAAAFFDASVSAPEGMAVIGLEATFPAEIARASGASEVTTWRLRVDAMLSEFPNAQKALSWLPGDGVAMELQWADRSGWRPLADPLQPQLQAQGAIARFAFDGPWALLRMIDTHCPPGAGGRTASPLLLRFDVPVQTVAPGADGKPRRDEGRVFMQWRLTGTDPASKAVKPLALPAQFPRSAPTD